MRRFVALLILCVLPLQWSYAAMAEYCQHQAEVEAAQDHVGHHEHEHVDESPDSKTKKSSLADLDCPGCQHSTAATILELAPVTFPPLSVAPIVLLSQSIRHRSPDNPFRPPLAAGL